MKTIFKWIMNPDNNPIMFFVALMICVVCVGLSMLRAA